jgi:hypothetical protein
VHRRFLFGPSENQLQEVELKGNGIYGKFCGDSSDAIINIFDSCKGWIEHLEFSFTEI